MRVTRDGSHIKNLFYTFIWNFCPDLVKEGYIYALVPPLYKVILPKNQGYKYLKNDAELEDYRKTHGEGYQVQRFKGLGELSMEETEETLLDPNNRILTQVTVEDVKATSALFENLMGTAVAGRKKFIEENSEKAGQYNAE